MCISEILGKKKKSEFVRTDINLMPYAIKNNNVVA